MGEQSDHELLDRIRMGDEGARAELWTRHYAAAARAAQEIEPNCSADEVATEAFSRLLAAMTTRRRPVAAFRPYVLRTVANLMQLRREPQDGAGPDVVGGVDRIVPTADPDLAGTHRSVAVRAYQRLRPEYRHVLWYVDVEGLNHAQAARYLGKTPVAARSLAARAQADLRREFVQLRLGAEPAPMASRRGVEQLSGDIRNPLRPRDHHRIELTMVERSLRAGVIPLVMGTGVFSVRRHEEIAAPAGDTDTDTPQSLGFADIDAVARIRGPEPEAPEPTVDAEAEPATEPPLRTGRGRYGPVAGDVAASTGGAKAASKAEVRARPLARVLAFGAGFAVVAAAATAFAVVSSAPDKIPAESALTYDSQSSGSLTQRSGDGRGSAGDPSSLTVAPTTTPTTEADEHGLVPPAEGDRNPDGTDPSVSDSTDPDAGDTDTSPSPGTPDRPGHSPSRTPGPQPDPTSGPTTSPDPSDPSDPEPEPDPSDSPTTSPRPGPSQAPVPSEPLPPPDPTPTPTPDPTSDPEPTPTPTQSAEPTDPPSAEPTATRSPTVL